MSIEYGNQGEGKPALMREFNPPPVCTAFWTEDDWRRWEGSWSEQPDTITNSIGIFQWTGELDGDGLKLYRLA